TAAGQPSSTTSELISVVVGGGGEEARGGREGGGQASGTIDHCAQVVLGHGALPGQGRITERPDQHPRVGPGLDGLGLGKSRDRLPQVDRTVLVAPAGTATPVLALRLRCVHVSSSVSSSSVRRPRATRSWSAERSAS